MNSGLEEKGQLLITPEQRQEENSSAFLSALGNSVAAVAVVYLLACRLGAATAYGITAAKGIAKVVSPLEASNAVSIAIFALETLANANFAYAAHLPKLAESVANLKEKLRNMQGICTKLGDNPGETSWKECCTGLWYGITQLSTLDFSFLNGVNTEVSLNLLMPEQAAWTFAAGYMGTSANYYGHQVYDSFYPDPEKPSPAEASVLSRLIMCLSIISQCSTLHFFLSTWLGSSSLLAKTASYLLPIFAIPSLWKSQTPSVYTAFKDFSLRSLPATYLPKDYSPSQLITSLLRVTADSLILMGNIGMVKNLFTEIIPAISTMEEEAYKNGGAGPIALAATVLACSALIGLAGTITYTSTNTEKGHKNIREKGNLWNITTDAAQTVFRSPLGPVTDTEQTNIQEPN